MRSKIPKTTSKPIIKIIPMIHRIIFIPSPPQSLVTIIWMSIYPFCSSLVLSLRQALVPGYDDGLSISAPKGGKSS